MKDKLVKVKRKRVNWIKVLTDLNDEAMLSYYFKISSKLHKGRSVSFNRAAYSTIRHFYSTTTIDQTMEKLGL